MLADSSQPPRGAHVGDVRQCRNAAVQKKRRPRALCVLLPLPQIVALTVVKQVTLTSGSLHEKCQHSLQPNYEIVLNLMIIW
jgi:hypothetical protein